MSDHGVLDMGIFVLWVNDQFAALLLTGNPRFLTSRQVGAQMTNRPTAASIDEYIAAFPEPTQQALNEVRGLVREIAPDATETISYAIPTFDMNGRHLVHFAGYERHIGLYPTPTGMEEFKEALAPFKQGKGSVQFPLSEPLPMDLIRRIVEFRVQEVLGKSAT